MTTIKKARNGLWRLDLTKELSNVEGGSQYVIHFYYDRDSTYCTFPIDQYHEACAQYDVFFAQLNS